MTLFAVVAILVFAAAFATIQARRRPIQDLEFDAWIDQLRWELDER